MSLQCSMQTQINSTCTRRSTLLATAGLLSLSRLIQPARAAEVLQVGPGQPFASIAAAVAAAQPGSTVLIAPGRYEEQLVISSSITLAAAQPEGRVVIACDTQQPYVHCLEVPSSSSSSGGRLDVRVKGIWFEHFSKSVANNYCIVAQAGSLTLEQCDITSRSGVGVGVEGAAVSLKSCHIHDCERHGVAVFGSLEGDVGRCEVSDCSITSNKLNGILVKDGAELTVSASDVSANGGYGVQLSDCTAVLQHNTVARNRQGSVAAQLGTVTFDEEQLRAENKLSDELLLL